MRIAHIIRNIGAVIAVIIILISVVFLLLSYEPAIVMSGSMEPAYHTGSVLVVDRKQKKEVQVGDTIAFEAGDTYIAHRIVRKEKQGYVTKGDANVTVDPWIVAANNVKGKVIMTIPFLGYVFKFLSGTAGMIIAASLVILLGLSTLLEPENDNTGYNKNTSA